MKKKNYKIRITKNKITKKENQLNENEYDFTGDFKGMIDSFIDSAKMAALTFKRMFKASVFGVKTLNALRKLDKDAMNNLRGDFLVEDERMKQEQTSLINAQPGTKDLNKFLAMTSPGVLFFDKLILDPNKKDIVDKFRKTFGITKKDKKSKQQKEVAYYNFLMRVVEITHNAKVDLTTKEDLEKNIVKKPSSTVYKMTDDDVFKKAIAYIASFYTKLDYKIEDNIYFEISDELYVSLKMIHDANNLNKKAIINHLKAKNFENDFNRITKALKSGQMRARFNNAIKSFDYDGKLDKAEVAEKKAQEAAKAREEQKIEKEKESQQNDSYVIQIKSNNILLKEEEESKELGEEEKDIDFKSDMEASFSLFDLITLYLYVEKMKIFIERNTIFTNFNSAFINTLYNEKTISENSIKTLNDLRDKIISKSNLINNTIEEYNILVNEYNSNEGKESGIKLEILSLINNDKFTKTVNETGKKALSSATEFKKALEMKYDDLISSDKKESKVFNANLILEQEGSSASEEDKKRLEVSNSLCLELVDVFKSLEKIDLEPYFKNLVKDSQIISKRIDESHLSKGSKILAKFNIPKNYFSSLQNELSKIGKEIKTYNDSDKVIKDFINREKEIESELIKSLEESLKAYQQSKDSDDTDDSQESEEEEFSGKFTTTMIKSKKEDK